MRIPYMSKARGARLILDSNLARRRARLGALVEKICPVCGKVEHVPGNAPISAHFVPETATPCAYDGYAPEHRPQLDTELDDLRAVAGGH